MNVDNLANPTSIDPFVEEEEDLGSGKDVGSQQEYIHIRIQQRNGRKTLTTLQGVPKKFSSKKLLKAFKKEFACNGTVVKDEEVGSVIQLQGDHRIKVKNFLRDEGIDEDTIKLHGF